MRFTSYYFFDSMYTNRNLGNSNVWVNSIDTTCISPQPKQLLIDFVLSVQVMKMLVSILVVFVICWTPTLLYSTMVAFNNHPENRIIASRISLAFATLALANSCLNPILYAFLSRLVY